MNNLSTNFNFIGENTTFKGDLFLSGNTHVYGKVIGDIRGDKHITLTIEYSGQVQGNITGINVIIQGQLLGNISGANKVEVTSTGKSEGILTSKSFQIYPGAKITGDIRSIEISSNSQLLDS